MKKLLLSLFTLFTISLTVEAQTDTLYLNSKKIPCTVREVTQDAVKFSYPNEDMVNTIYKNSIQKIVFKSGRIETFAEASSYKQVRGIEDYANVTVTGVESEVRGLYKIGDVGAKAKGTTTLSNQERVKERAYRKLRIQAAMQGANIVYLTQQRNEGNKFGGYFQSGSTTETNLTGIAYSTVVPNLEDFKKVLNQRTSFGTYERYSLGASSSDYSKADFLYNFHIVSITDNNGIITVEGNLDSEPKYTQFKLTGFDSDHFNLFYQDKNTVYNFSVKL